MAPVQTFKALYDFKAHEEDELELTEGDVIDVSVIHEGEWGVGVSRRTQKEGLFPWSYVERYTSSQQQHQFELITVEQPTMCWHTREFIWGIEGKEEAYRCTVCGFTCQKRSRFFVENDRAYECVRSGRPPVQPITKPLPKWGIPDVQLFLLAAKLELYEQLFVNGKIDGSKLLTLNHRKLQALGVEDTLHRRMILSCIEELRTGKTKTTENSFVQRCNIARTEQLDPVQQMDYLPIKVPMEETRTIKDHQFKLKSFANMTWCDYSRKLLFGIERQGLQCSTCGYTVSAAYLDEVPSCREDKRFPVNAIPAGVDVGHVFGVPVEAQTLGGHQAPPVVEKCIAAIENGKGMKTTDLHKKLASADKLRTLQSELFTNADASLEGRDPHLLTTLLKRYFAELPDSLIPGEWYDRTIAAASLPTEEEQVAELDRVMSNIKGATATTLSYLLGHLGRVIANHKSTKMDAVSVAEAWGPILLRPKPSESAKAVADRQIQVNAVRLLIGVCKIGGVPTTASGAAPPLMPRRQKSMKRSSNAGPQSNYENINLPRSSTRHAATAPSLPPKPAEKIYEPVNLSMRNKTVNMTKEPWFAGNVNRVQAEKMLAGLVDGSFLVRSSQSRKGFSLTVKFREIRHIVLLEANGKYGFSRESCDFKTIAELVRHFEKETLAKYNAELETTLAYPYKQAPQAGAGDYDYDDGPDEDIYVSNVSELRKKVKRRQADWRHGMDAQRVAHFDKQMKDLQRRLKAQQLFKKMLEEHLKFNQTAQEHASDKDRTVVIEHFYQLRTMVADADKKEQVIADELAAVAQEDAQFRAQAEERLAEEPEEAAGLPRSEPPRMTPSRSISGIGGSSGDDLPSEYFVGSMSRQEAGAALAMEPPGTFLIRRSDRPDKPYSLSLKYGSEIKHIQIKFNGAHYGLAEPLAFPTVMKLVEYYQQQDLSASIATVLVRGINDVQ